MPLWALCAASLLIRVREPPAPIPHALRNVLTGDISEVVDVVEIRLSSADGPHGAYLRSETPGMTRAIQNIVRESESMPPERALYGVKRRGACPRAWPSTRLQAVPPASASARRGRVRGHARAFGESYTSIVGD